jgi:hypothetical protein
LCTALQGDYAADTDFLHLWQAYRVHRC